MGLLSTTIGQGIKAGSGLLDEILELYKTEPLAARKMAKRSGILDEIDSQIPRPKGDVSNAAALRAEANAQRVGDADYKGQHSAPMSGDNAPLHDLSQVYPDDIYSSKGLQYYGTGDNAIDSESMDIINSLKGKPDQTVTMYRAVPSDAGDVDINAGDWVSLSESYVKQHGESALNGDYKIISKEVPANQLFTNGDSINEFGFDPSSKGLLMDTPSRMTRAKEQGFDTDKKVYHGTADDFDAFDPDRAIGTQFWSTTNKAEIESGDVGAQGSGVIKEMYHRIKNPAGWDEYDKFGVDELISKGYDGLKLPDGKGDYTYVAFDPSQYRSVDAAFDPAKTGSSNLLASNPVATTAAGVGGLLAMTGSDDADAGVVGSLVKMLAKGKADGTVVNYPDELIESTPFELRKAIADHNESVLGPEYRESFGDTTFYRGGGSERSALKNDVWMSSDPYQASTYAGQIGGNVMPLKVRKGDIPEVYSNSPEWNRIGLLDSSMKIPSNEYPEELGRVMFNSEQSPYAVTDTNKIAQFAKDEGFGGVSIKGLQDIGPYQRGADLSKVRRAESLMLGDGSNARSVNAAFDPAKESSRNLLASNPAATTSAGILANSMGQESKGLMDAMAGRDAILTPNEVEYLNNHYALQQFLGAKDAEKFNYADIVPMKRNKETGERSFAMTGLLRDIIEAGHDSLIQPQRTGITNQQSLWDIIL